MIKAQVITQWQDVGNGNEPIIILLPGDSAMDVTGQQNMMPSPNVVVWELWVEDIVPYETDLEILWWEEIDEEQI